MFQMASAPEGEAIQVSHAILDAVGPSFTHASSTTWENPIWGGERAEGKEGVLSKLIVWLNVLCSSPHLAQSQGGEGSVGGMPVVLPWGFSPVSPVTDSWYGSQHVH